MDQKIQGTKINSFKEEQKEYNMDNSRTDIDDFLTVRGFGGYGYGGGYGGGHGSYASPSANAVRIDRNKDATDFTNLNLGKGLDSINNNFESLIRSQQFTAVLKGQTDAEFRTADRLRDLQDQINNNAKEAALCCCNAKLDACKSHAELMAEIKAVESRTIGRELDDAKAEITWLRSQVNGGHPHHP